MADADRGRHLPRVARRRRRRARRRDSPAARPSRSGTRDADLHGVDAVVLPGGFSYGDYLRCGAIARFAPVMEPLVDAAHGGLPVLGICNGFQVLCESHLLPGALIRNDQPASSSAATRGCASSTPSTAWTSRVRRRARRSSYR